jgi:hypothetical protein
LSALDVPRKLGTRSESHFEVVVIDKTTKKISLICIGSPARDGIDQDKGEETEIREIYYGVE